jgi:hypothetical protein
MASNGSTYTASTSSQGGMIVLCSFLAIGLLVFLFLWIFCLYREPDNSNNKAFGPFGVQAGVDANPVSSCGTDRSTPCIFGKNNLADCITECDTLQSICNAFTFNFSTSTMKIVQPGSTYASPNSNLFVRQPGLV